MDSVMLDLLTHAARLSMVGPRFSPEVEQKGAEMAKAAVTMAGSVKDLQGPQVRPLWDQMIMGPYVVDALEFLQQVDIIKLMFPELQLIVGFGGIGHKDLWAHTKQVVSQCPPRPIIRWAALFHDIGKFRCYNMDPTTFEVSFHGHEKVGANLVRSLHARVDIFKIGYLGYDDGDYIAYLIESLGRVEGYSSRWTDSAVRRIYRDIVEGWRGPNKEDVFEDLAILCKADITTKHDDKRAKFQRLADELLARGRELARIDAIPPALPTGLGDALGAEFGLPPSKALGDIMKALKAIVEAGELPRNEKVETLVAFVKANPNRFFP